MTNGTKQIAREVAARVWCDRVMRSIEMDHDAVAAIAYIIAAVLEREWDWTEEDEASIAGSEDNAQEAEAVS